MFLFVNSIPCSCSTAATAVFFGTIRLDENGNLGMKPNFSILLPQHPVSQWSKKKRCRQSVGRQVRYGQEPRPTKRRRKNTCLSPCLSVHAIWGSHSVTCLRVGSFLWSVYLIYCDTAAILHPRISQ